MASYTSSSYITTDSLNIGSVQPIYITIPSREFPSGTVSFSGLSWWYLTGGASPNVVYTFKVYLCDSSGGNRAEICEVNITGNNNYHAGVTSPTSGSVNATGLENKALYIVAECTKISVNDTEYYRSLATSRFQIRGSSVRATVNTANAYSGSSFSVGNVNFGSASTVTISNTYISALWHKVTWTIDNSHTYSQNTSTGATSASYTIPSSWMETVPSSTSINMTVTVTTYNASTGANLGSSSKTVTVSVPSNVGPSIGSISAAVYNPRSGFSGTYIQNKTGVQFTLNNVAAGSYASISSYSISITPNESYTRNGNTITVSNLTHSGTVTLRVSLTDSRSRQSAVYMYSITVLAYSNPVITAASAYRCKNTGVASETGTYAAIKAVASCADISGNSVTVNSTYYLSTTPGTKNTAANNMASGSTYVIGGGNLQTNKTYYIEFTATDTLGGTTTLTVQVQTAAYSIHVKNGGLGVAFGKTSEIDGAVEINPSWNLYYKGVAVVPVVYNSTAPSNPFAGLVWLKPKS